MTDLAKECIRLSRLLDATEPGTDTYKVLAAEHLECMVKLRAEKSASFVDINHEDGIRYPFTVRVY